MKYVKIAEFYPADSNAPALTPGTWQPRQFLTVETDETGGVSVPSAGVVAVAAGSYIVRARAPGWGCGSHQARLWDLTRNLPLLDGSNAWSGSPASPSQDDSCVVGKIVLTQPTQLQLQHNCNVPGGYGGVATGFGTETYAVLELWLEP